MASMLSVVGSSRISNTVYIAAGSIFVTLIYSLAGIQLQISLDTGLVIISAASIFGVVFWATEPEKRVIHRLALSIIVSRGQWIKTWMADDVLLVKPWQSAVLDSIPIDDAIKGEVKFILNSPAIKEDIQRLYLLFWLMVTAYPFEAILIQPFLSGLLINPILFAVMLIIGIVGPIILAYILLWGMKRRPLQIVGLGYLHWLKDLIETDARRREGNPDFRGIEKGPHRLKTRSLFLEHTNEILQEWKSRGWDWIDQGLKQFTSIKMSSFLLGIDSQDFNDLVQDILHCFKLEKGNYFPEFPRSSLKNESREVFESKIIKSSISVVLRINMKEQIRDALVHIQKPWTFPDEFSTPNIRNIAQSQLDTIHAINDLVSGNALSSPSSLLMSLDKTTLEMLKDSTLMEFAKLPYLLSHSKEPSFSGQATPSTVVAYLLGAAKQEYVDSNLVLSVARKWDINPKLYASILSPKQARLFLEGHLKYQPLDLVAVVDNVMKIAQQVDVEVMRVTLSEMSNEPKFQELVTKIVKSGEKLGWDMKEIQGLLQAYSSIKN